MYDVFLVFFSFMQPECNLSLRTSEDKDFKNMFVGNNLVKRLRFKKCIAIAYTEGNWISVRHDIEAKRS